MPVRVVAGSVAGLPPQVAKALGTTVIPFNVRFGEKVYWAMVSFRLLVGDR